MCVSVCGLALVCVRSNDHSGQLVMCAQKAKVNATALASQRYTQQLRQPAEERPFADAVRNAVMRTAICLEASDCTVAACAHS